MSIQTSLFQEFGAQRFVMTDKLSCCKMFAKVGCSFFLNIKYNSGIIIVFSFPQLNWISFKMKDRCFFLFLWIWCYFTLYPLNNQTDPRSLGKIPYSLHNINRIGLLRLHNESLLFSRTVLVGGHRGTKVTMPKSKLVMYVACA